MMKRVFPILALSMFSSTLGMGIVAPLLPLYVRDLGITGVWLGVIFASFFISNSLIVPIAGRLSDRRGRKLFLSVGLLTYSFASLGYVWSNNTPELILVRLLQGIAGAMTFPIATACIGDLSPQGEEGRWMGYANAAFGSGIGLGPLIGGTLSEHFGMSTAFYAMAGLNLIAFLIVLFLLPEINPKEAVKGPGLSFKEVRQSGIIKGIFSFRLAEAFGRGGAMTFLPIFASMLGLSITLIGVLLSISTMLTFLLAPLGGILADKFDRRALIISGNVILILSLAMIPMTKNFGQLLAVLLIQGLSAAITMPAASALTVEEGRKFGMGATMGIFMMAMSLGNAIGPIMGGAIADLTNIDSVFYVAAGMAVIGTGLFVWFTRRARLSQTDNTQAPMPS